MRALWISTRSAYRTRRSASRCPWYGCGSRINPPCSRTSATKSSRRRARISSWMNAAMTSPWSVLYSAAIGTSIAAPRLVASARSARAPSIVSWSVRSRKSSPSRSAIASSRPGDVRLSNENRECRCIAPRQTADGPPRSGDIGAGAEAYEGPGRLPGVRPQGLSDVRVRAGGPVLADPPQPTGAPQIREVVVERPVEPAVGVERLVVLEPLAAEDPHQVRGEVDAGAQRELRRAPELPVDLDEDELPGPLVALELDHRHAVPGQRVEHAQPGVSERGVEDGARGGTRAAAHGELADALVHEDADRAAPVVEREEPEGLP